MTQEIKNRIHQAINETKRTLNKELAYQRHLQNDELVSFCMNHIAKLEAQLNEN